VSTEEQQKIEQWPRLWRTKWRQSFGTVGWLTNPSYIYSPSYMCLWADPSGKLKVLRRARRLSSFGLTKQNKSTLLRQKGGFALVHLLHSTFRILHQASVPERLAKAANALIYTNVLHTKPPNRGSASEPTFNWLRPSTSTRPFLRKPDSLERHSKATDCSSITGLFFLFELLAHVKSTSRI